MNSEDWLLRTGPLCAFISSVTWALASSTYSRLSNVAHPFAINFSRALVGFPFFIAAVLISSALDSAENSTAFSGALEAYSHVSSSSVTWLAISMVASFGIGDSLFFWATLSLGVPGALAIASSYPAWTVLFTAFQTGQWIPPMQVLGLLITLVGVMLVILKAPKASQNTARSRGLILRGVIFAFITSFCWAMNGYSVMRASEGHSAALLNTIRMPAAMIVTAIFGLVYARNRPIWIPWPQLKSVFWIIVMEVSLGSSCYVYGMANSSLVVGATLGSLAPVISVPIAWSLKLEKPSGWRAFGVSMVVLGLILLLNGSV